MRTAVVALTLIGILPTCASRRALGQSQNRRDLTIVEPTKIDGERSSNTGSGVRSKLSVAGDDLMRMSMESDNTMAVFAQWVMSLDDRLPQRDQYPARFIGFLEGRLSIPIPRHWEYRLLHCYLDELPRRREIIAKMLSGLDDVKRIDKTSQSGIRGLRTGKNVTISDDGQRITVSTKGGLQRSVSISKKEFAEIVNEHTFSSTVEALFDTDNCYLAIFEETGEYFPIICIENKTGRIKWHTTVWALGAEKIGIKTGSWFHGCFITVGKDRVGVFGFGGRGECYVDVFLKDNGKPICRFATNYWRDSDK